MTFWDGVLVGWLLGMVTLPLLFAVGARLLAWSFDKRDRQRRMSAEWLRERGERGAYVSPEAQEWLKRTETGGGNGPEQG